MGELTHFLSKVIIDHFTVICNALVYFIIVAVSCMPKPGTQWTGAVVYAWFYDTLQTALPINRFLHGNLPQTTTVITVPQQAQVTPVEQTSAIGPVKPLSDAITRFGKN